MDVDLRNSATITADVINNAIVQCATGAKPGGTVWLPAGTYPMDKTITLNRAAVSLQGAGREVTQLVFNATTSPVGVSFNGYGANGEAMTLFGPGRKLSGLALKCNTTRHPGTTGLLLNRMAHCYLEDLRIEEFDRGIRNVGSLIFEGERCHVLKNNTGMYIDAANPSPAYPTATPILPAVLSANLWTLRRWFFEQNKKYVIRSFTDGASMRFEDCQFEGNTCYVDGVSGTTNNAIEFFHVGEAGGIAPGLTFQNCWFEANTATNEVYLDTSPHANVAFSGCGFYSFHVTRNIMVQRGRLRLSGCGLTSANQGLKNVELADFAHALLDGTNLAYNLVWNKSGVSGVGRLTEGRISQSHAYQLSGTSLDPQIAGADTRVVGVQQPAVPSPTGVAGASYGANEQAMLLSLKQSLTDVLQRMRDHGLIAN